MSRYNKDLKQLVRAAEAEGWEVTPTRGGHLKWVAPDGRIVFSGSTLSDWRALKNIRAMLKLTSDER